MNLTHNQIMMMNVCSLQVMFRGTANRIRASKPLQCLGLAKLRSRLARSLFFIVIIFFYLYEAMKKAMGRATLKFLWFLCSKSNLMRRKISFAESMLTSYIDKESSQLFHQSTDWLFTQSNNEIRFIEVLNFSWLLNNIQQIFAYFKNIVYICGILSSIQYGTHIKKTTIWKSGG